MKHGLLKVMVNGDQEYQQLAAYKTAGVDFVLSQRYDQ